MHGHRLFVDASRPVSNAVANAAAIGFANATALGVALAATSVGAANAAAPIGVALAATSVGAALATTTRVGPLQRVGVQIPSRLCVV